MKKTPILALAMPLCLQAQEWTYQVYRVEGFPADQPITFLLKETSPGQHSGRFIVGGTLDDCIRREVKATVRVEGAEQVVVLPAAMVGCPERRLLLKTDGSGGRMEVKQGDGTWLWDGRERGLKRKP